MTALIEPLTCGTKSAMTISGHNSDSAFYRWAGKVGLPRLGNGRYLITDVRDAVIKESMRAKRKIAATNKAKTTDV